jgi:hypothetical protein
MQGQTAGVNTNVDNEARNFDPKQAFGLTSNMGKFGTAVTIGVGLATSGIKGGIRGVLIKPAAQLAYALHQSQSPSIEEALRGGGHADRTYPQLLFVPQVDLIGTNLFRSQQLWRLVEVPCKFRYFSGAGGLCNRRKVPQLHYLDEPLPKRCHGKR